jgi:hypothetical protein
MMRGLFSVSTKEGSIMKKLLLGALLLAGCAQGRAEERAVEFALKQGFVAPVADCDGERKDLPGFLLCNVEETEGEPRGILVACPSGLADGPCVEPPAGNGFKVNEGRS